jgi:hypothetical protein
MHTNLNCKFICTYLDTVVVGAAVEFGDEFVVVSK